MTLQHQWLEGDIASAKAEATRLMQGQRFAEAAQHAERVLRLTEMLHGEDAVASGVAAHNLGFLLSRAGRPQDAQGHLERALGIYTRSLPAVHEDTRNAVGELGQLYAKAGRTDEVVRLYEALIARAGREGYARHVGTAHSHNSLAFLLRSLQRHQESQTHWEEAISIYAEISSPGDEPYRLAVEALLDRYAASAQHDKARSLASDALRKLAPGRVRARLLLRLSDMEHAAGRYGEARTQAAQALEILDPKGDSTSVEAAGALNSLARAERALANFVAAEGAYRRAIAIFEAQGDKANAGILHDNLAVLYGAMSRYRDAEKHHKQALRLIEASLGREHRSAGRAAANLGALLLQSGRMTEAEPLLQRGLQSAEAHTPQDPVAIATNVDNLAGVLRLTGRHDMALPLLRRAVSMFETSLPASHPSLATVRNNLGRLLLDTGAFAEAEALLSQALQAAEALHGADHPSVAVALGNLGDLHLATGRSREARSTLERAIGMIERRLGQEHSSLLIALVRLGQTELAEGQAGKAAAVFDRAVSIELARRSLGGARQATDARTAIAEREAFTGLIEALWRSGGATDGRNITRALEIGQWDTITAATVALAALGARLGAGDASLAGLAREQQDLTAEWSARDKRLTEVLSQGGERDVAFEASLRERLATIEVRLTTVDRELQIAFPRYGDLARPAPVAIADAQGLLGPNEAVLQYVVTPSATHLWLVAATETRWVRLPVGERELTTMVRALRCGLDRAQWAEEGPQSCLTVLGVAVHQAPGPEQPLPFDLGRAHDLYRLLVGSVEESIKGKDLLLVLSGPLTALPFHALVREQPAPDAAADYQHAAWLAKSHAITVLPALASLKALRRAGQASRASRPFIGFGNPLLTGASGTDRRAWARQSCTSPTTTLPRPAIQGPGAAGRLLGGALSNVEELRRQMPLPETADELCAVAAFTQATPEDVFLGERATERQIKALSRSGALAKARVLHLATHGLLASETAALAALRAEPALMLTPPGQATEEDDGLLTASEVAAMRLDADWVVLSACNTASGDGLGAEALSGLARAFFYAGARALLVSHWAVDSEATVKLVTRTFEELGRSPERGRSRALRQSMTALIENGGRDAHPELWAPFVVVGEGGAVAPLASQVAR